MSTALAMAQAGDHPLTFEDYVGQEVAKRQVMVAIRSAQARRARLDHTLIAHPDPGIGKTSLALLIAIELGVGVKVVSGQMSFDQVRQTLASSRERDIVIFEEIHRLFDGGKKAAEWLLHLMQHDVLLGPLGAEQMPRVTLIGTTTDAGRIPEPIFDRFGNKPKLVSYTEDDGALIVLKLATKIFTPEMPLPAMPVAYRIARAAANRPRAMRDMLAKLRDLVVIGDLDAEPDYCLDEVLAWQGVTEDGLTELAQRYLEALSRSYGVAGIKAIADDLGELEMGLKETERLLLAKGLLKRTPRGRMLTTAGQQRVQDLVAA